jgi:hypothetical protein
VVAIKVRENMFVKRKIDVLKKPKVIIGQILVLSIDSIFFLICNNVHQGSICTYILNFQSAAFVWYYLFYLVSIAPFPELQTKSDQNNLFVCVTNINLKE